MVGETRKAQILVSWLLVTLIVGTVTGKGCMNVKKCLCADGGDNCMSPRVFEDDLIGYFSFDEQLVADDSGMLLLKPEAIPGPGYGLTMSSLYSPKNYTYNISGKVLEGQESFSISFWIYIVRRGDGWNSILKKGKHRMSSTPTLSISSHDGTLELSISTTKEPVSTMLSNGSIQTARWTHVAISLSLNVAALFINGYLDIERNYDEKILFNNEKIEVGAFGDRTGAEMLIDELKLFNTFLSKQRIVENMGGDNVPFGVDTVKLSCLDCSMKEAFFGCQEGYHLASTQELIAGGYQVALANGWNKMNTDFWTLDPLRPNVPELRYDNPLKKAGVCFKDRLV